MNNVKSAKSVSHVLHDLELWIGTKKSVPLGSLIDRLGEKGLVFVIVVLSIPFLQPVPMFGLSTVFGAVVMLLGLGIMLDRELRLPAKFAKRQIPSSTLKAVCAGGYKVFSYIEKFVKPRGHRFCESSFFRRLSGFFIIMSAFLLALPIPIPGTNTPPALAMFLLSFGFMERDAYIILAGYVAFVATVVYFAFLGWASIQGVSLALPFFENTP